MKRRLKFTLLAGFLVFSGACARPQFDGPPRIPQVASPQVIEHMDTSDQRPLELTLPAGEYSSGDLFLLLTMNGARGKTAAETPRAIIEAFYSGKGTHSSVRLSRSPYADFLIENTRNPFVMNTYNLDEQRDGQLLNVRLLLQRRSWYLKQAHENLTAPELFGIADRYLNETRQDLAIGRLEPKIRDGIIAGLDKIQFELFQPAKQRLDDFENARQLPDLLKILHQLISEMGIKLEVETEEQFAVAERFAGLLNATTNTRAGLTLLVEVWDQLPEDQREQIFLQASPDFYKFMKTSTVEERTCLKSGPCNGLGTKIAKHLFILPAIEQYGVERLRSEIQTEVLKTMKAGVRRVLRESLVDLPRRLNAEIRAEVEQEYSRIAGYTQDYSQFVRKELDGWFAKQFKSNLAPALEVDRVRVETTPSRLRMEGIADERGRLVVSADTFGKVLAAIGGPVSVPGIARKMSEQQRLLLWGLTRFNQIVGFESWLTTHQQLSFFPHKSSLVEGNSLSRRSHAVSLDVGAQASLLQGFVATARYARDWDPHPRRLAIDGTLLKELMPRLPSDSLQVPAFSGEVLLAKALYNASLILTQLKAPGTPLFQVCPDRRVRFFDSATACSSLSSIVGLANVVEGLRQTKNQTQDVARFLIGVLDFLEFAEQELPQTRSPYLLQTRIPNRPPAAEELKLALPELKQLAIGLTHFLGSEALTSQGEVLATFSIAGSGGSRPTHDLSSQLIGLEALSRAARYFNVAVYRRSAMSAYSYLNRQFWDARRGFYQGSTATPTWLEGYRVWQALRSFRPLLSEPRDQARVDALLTRITPDKQ